MSVCQGRFDLRQTAQPLGSRVDSPIAPNGRFFTALGIKQVAQTVESSTVSTNSSARSQRALALLDASPFPVVLWRPLRDQLGTVVDFLYVDANDAAVTYLRRSRSDVVGHRLHELFSGEVSMMTAKWATEMLESGQPLELESQTLTIDETGDERRFDISMIPAESDVIFLWRDVTQSFVSSRELQDSERTLRIVMDTAPVAMNLTASDGAFLQCNPAMCTFLGRTEAELKNTTWQAVTHPEDLAADLAMACEVLEGTRDTYRLTKRFHRGDGTVVWGDLAVAAVRDDAGQFLFFIAQIADVTELMRSRDMLAESQDHYRLLAENTSDVVLRLTEGHVAWVSPSVTAILGYPQHEVLGRPIRDFIAHAEWPAIESALQAAAQDLEAGAGGQFRVRRRLGTWLWMDATGRSVRDHSGLVSTVVRLRDVDDEVRARRALETSEERFRTAMRAAPIGMALTTRDGVILQVNAGLTRMLGIDEEQMRGQRVTSFTHPDDHAIDLEMFNVLHSGRASEVTREKRLVDAQGQTLWVLNAIAGGGEHDDGRYGSFVAQFLDVTDTRQAHEALAELALLDPLTALRNRRAVLEHMEAVLDHAPRRGTSLAILYIDVDRFKAINDRYGHLVGDAVLVEIADRMRKCLRQEDAVGRLGGDEFLAVLPQMTTEADAITVAENLRRAVARPIEAQGCSIRATISIGLTLAAAGESPESVVSRADQLLYDAKSGGRDRIVSSVRSNIA